tara:strand:- start:568 stop:2031 length:1464 start_codon:yes stop_codon:yes gene_type:complete
MYGQGTIHSDRTFYDPTQASGGGSRYDEYVRRRVAAGTLDPNRIAAQNEQNAISGTGPFQQGTGDIDPRYQTGGDEYWFPNDPTVGEGGTGQITDYDVRNVIDPNQFPLDPLGIQYTKGTPTTTTPDDGSGNGTPGVAAVGPTQPLTEMRTSHSQSNIAAMPEWAKWSGPSTTYTAGQVPMDRLSTYDPYAISQDPISTYDHQRGTYSQFLNPNLSNVQQPAEDVMRQVLSERVMSDDVVGMMREQQKEQALAQQEQMLQQMGAGAAARGTYGGGRQLAREADIRQGTSDQLIRGARDLQVQQAQANRQDELAALGAAEQFLTGRTGRETEMFRTRLGGETAQEAALQEAARSDQAAAALGLTREQAQAMENYRGHQSQVDAQRDFYQRFLDQEKLNQEQAQQALRDYMGRGQLDIGRMDQWLDHQGLQERGRQFDDSLALQDYLGRGRLDLGWGGLGVQERLGMANVGVARQRANWAESVHNPANW